MVQYHSLRRLPTAAELPDSDETPVDNELQNLGPNLLLSLLCLIWAERQDWYFGVDMGVYYLTETPQRALVPDGFLSLGVVRRKGPNGRLSYVLWEENYIPPILGVEFVSKKYRGEYGAKMQKYKKLGVLYYMIYNPDYWQRHQHQPFEVYRLENDRYVLQQGEPYWMPEIGLALGRAQGTYEGWTREWLYWFDEAGNRALNSEEQLRRSNQQVEFAEQRAAFAEQRATSAEQQLSQAMQELEQLRAQLRDRAINPEIP